MQLAFEGDIGLATAAVVATCAGLVVWTLYRGDVVGRASRWAWAPAALRVTAVVLIVFMLTGPVLRGTVRLNDRSKVLVLVDESQSMDLSDETMTAARKLWLAQQRGWLATSEFDASPLRAAIHLDNFVAIAGELAPENTAGETAGQTASSQNEMVAKAVEELKLAAQSTPAGGAVRNELESKLLTPIQHLKDPSNKSAIAHKPSWSELAAVAVSLRSRLRKSAADQAEQKVRENGAAIQQAIDRFDKRTRWQRLENVLLTADDASLPALAINHDLQVHSIAGVSGKSRLIWKEKGENQEPPSTLGVEVPQGAITDLAESVAEIVGEQPLGGSLAVVLLTDGQHNHSATNRRTPTHIAKLLAKRGAPLYTVGFGAANPPRDLAILGVHAPESVFADDRVKGRILLKDNMPPGKTLALKIELEGEQLWERRLQTNGANARTVDFDFSIAQPVKDRLARTAGQADSISLPLPLKVRIAPVEGELRDDNNEYDAHVRAITRPRRILMIDGRPRWEQRYIRNLFRRDQQWEVNDVLVEWNDDGFSLPRGSRPQQFPADRDGLFAYDLIVFGEVPRAVFRREELQWINQFVASRGGGVIFIDGRRGKLRQYADTPLESLLPVRWVEPNSDVWRPSHLSLADAGQTISAFAFDGDSENSAQRWRELPPPHWTAPAETLPGAETLVTASRGEETRPAIVQRRFGAGNVLYCGSDETWRWRYEMADFYHQRFWNQVAGFVMEPPYAVHSRHVSIDTGGFTFQREQSAALRVRLRDRRGQPVTDATVTAILSRDGETVSETPLKVDQVASGVFHGDTDSLTPGAYKVRVRATGFSDQQLDVAAEFVVLGEPTGELNRLTCNEQLLRQMAQATGGKYLREEEIGQLTNLLAPMSEGRTNQQEWALWRSWLWFLPLVGLFSCEWLMRKRLGLM